MIRNNQTTIDFSKWTDKMVANHFGQSKTKDEIEKIVGRPIDWLQNFESDAMQQVTTLRQCVIELREIIAELPAGDLAAR